MTSATARANHRRRLAVLSLPEADKIISRLVEAVLTGEHCGTSDNGPRRVAAISLRGFHLLIKHNILAEGMRQVGEIENPHPRARQRFLYTWTKSLGCLLRELTCDDNAFFAGLRVLLPPCDGAPVTLYRGQLGRDHLGVSWTENYWVALKYALYGACRLPRNCDLSKPEPVKGLRLRQGGVIIRARVRPHQIVSATCQHLLNGPGEGEYVVDPRWLKGYEIDEGTS